MSRCFCGLAQNINGLADNGIRAWSRTHTVTWTVLNSMDGFSVQDLKDLMKKQIDHIKSNCGLKSEYTSSSNANIVISVTNIPDRDPGGILGQANLPWAGIPRDSQLPLMFDSGDRWTTATNWQNSGKFPIQPVGLHEFIHTFGVGHLDDEPDIMNSSISNIREMMAPSIAEMRLRYGLPGDVTPEEPGDEPSDDNICSALFRMLGKFFDEQNIDSENLTAREICDAIIKILPIAPDILPTVIKCINQFDEKELKKRAKAMQKIK